MRKEPPYTSYNLFFLVPYFLWLITGGLLLGLFDKQTLFAAVNTHYSPIADTLMYYTTWMGEGITVTVLLLLLLIIVPAFRNGWYFIAALFCNVLPTLVTQWIKHAVNAPRPLKYFHNASWIHILPSWPRYMHTSFPSGHSTGAFSMFCFLSMLLPAKYKGYGILFFILALAVGYSRMYLAAHFFADVYSGSITGGCGALLIFAVMNRAKYLFYKKQLA